MTEAGGVWKSLFCPLYFSPLLVGLFTRCCPGLFFFKILIFSIIVDLQLFCVLFTFAYIWSFPK